TLPSCPRFVWQRHQTHIDGREIDKLGARLPGHCCNFYTGNLILSRTDHAQSVGLTFRQATQGATQCVEMLHSTVAASPSEDRSRGIPSMRWPILPDVDGCGNDGNVAVESGGIFRQVRVARENVVDLSANGRGLARKLQETEPSVRRTLIADKD